MKFAMCNEFCQGWSVDDVCRLAAETGYQGVEFAPFTLGKTVYDISEDQRLAVRRTVREHGLETVGLHWLLAKTEGLHINHPDQAIRDRTLSYYEELIRCCAQLGGNRMIHGSPQQRAILPGETYDATMARTIDFFAKAAATAQAHDVVLCVEPLGRDDANFINTMAEAVRIIEAVNHPHVQLILDCKAMIDEPTPIPDLIRGGARHLRHFHANDNNRSYPGTGSIDFKAVLSTLKAINYREWVSIEVFDFTPPPATIADEGLAHLKRMLA